MDQDRLALLKRIGEARFTCVELNLYLDTHPDDMAARADFNTYSDKLQALLDTYTSTYGPLMNFGQCALDTGSWVRLGPVPLALGNGVIGKGESYVDL